MREQRERSRQASDFSVTTSFDSLPETEFVGYESLGCEGELQAVEEADGSLQVVLSRSPFYGESGGQVGDQGVISGTNFRLAVENTQRDGGRMIHVCRLVEGEAGELAAGPPSRRRSMMPRAGRPNAIIPLPTFCTRP